MSNDSSRFKALNELLDSIAQEYQRIRHTYKLEQARVERWRWDEPYVILTWLHDDEVNRIIDSLIRERKPKNNDVNYTLMVEVHAWQDKDMPGDVKSVRRWQHKQIEHINITAGMLRENHNVAKIFDRAYFTVSNWSRKDVRRKKHLPSLPAML